MTVLLLLLLQHQPASSACKPYLFNPGWCFTFMKTKPCTSVVAAGEIVHK
jgi:hypothetical protein